MDAADLLIRLHELGVTFALTPKGPVIRTPDPCPPDVSAELQSLLPLVREHRDNLLRLSPVSTDCEVCGHGIHHPDPATVYLCCGRADCPWRGGG